MTFLACNNNNRNLHSQIFLGQGEDQIFLCLAFQKLRPNNPLWITYELYEKYLFFQDFFLNPGYFFFTRFPRQFFIELNWGVGTFLPQTFFLLNLTGGTFLLQTVHHFYYIDDFYKITRNLQISEFIHWRFIHICAPNTHFSHLG